MVLLQVYPERYVSHGHIGRDQRRLQNPLDRLWGRSGVLSGLVFLNVSWRCLASHISTYARQLEQHPACDEITHLSIRHRHRLPHLEWTRHPPRHHRRDQDPRSASLALRR